MSRQAIAAAGLLSAVLVFGRSALAEESVEKAITRGRAWLNSQQAADGGWHSETYGAYRGGVGTTAIAVRALSEGNTERPESCQRGLTFLTTRRDERGFVVAPDGSSDNALSATAITVRLLAHEPKGELRDARKLLEKTLSDAQYLDAKIPDSPDVGGFASLVTAQDEVGSETPCNLSATTAVLIVRPPRMDLRPALKFVRRCQNFGEGTHNDGGFFFTPHVDHPLNKLSTAATPSGKLHPVSYFPATCDGIVCESIFGREGRTTSPGDAAWVRAMKRLETLPRPSLKTAAPTPDGPQPSPIDGLYFYSAAAFGEVWWMHPLNRPPLQTIRDEFVKTIMQRQGADGAWINPVKTMREDDPLIATSLAIIALQKLSKE
jgi:hypothetical protein